MNPDNENAEQAELTSADLVEEVSIDGMCGVY
ncbi:mycofactocin precursor MftA [Nocardioides sp. C4-1]